MVTLRVTAKLASRLKAVLEPNPPPSTGRLGDWYANILFLRPAHLVLCVSERTLLPVVLPAKNLATLPEQLVAGLGEVLFGIGVDPAAIFAEQDAMIGHVFAKTANRRVLGTMNDFAWMMEAGRRPESPLETSLSLAETPCSPIGMSSPSDATLALLGGTPRNRRRQR